MRAPDHPVLSKGDTLLAVEDVSLRFGGVKALTDVSFDIRKGVISARVKVRDMKPHPVGQATMLEAAE